MNRNLGIERVYSLGDYKSLRVIDNIENIPEELVLNPRAVDLLRVLQLVSIDLVHQRYLSLTRTLDQYATGSPERQSALQEIRADVMDELKDLFNQIKKEE